MSVVLQEIEKYKEQRNMNNLLENRWLSMFLQLIQYKEEHGNTDVPAKYKQYKPLGYWVRRQRLIYNEGKIDPLRENLLKLAGFNFRLLESHDWDSMFEKLVNFKTQFGHVRVTESYSDSQLHNWLIYQRKLYWRGKLSAMKIRRLKDLGVDMHNKTMNRWDNKYAQLVQFKKKYGHLYVCKHFTDDKQLIGFVKVIRRGKGKISDERRKKLDKLGFIWNPGRYLTILLSRKRADEAWLKRYEELKDYKDKFGTCRIPTTSKTHHSLANWISMQRNNTKRLTPERLRLLNGIDFFKDNYPGRIKKEK